jgi:hypothetical protein
LGDAELDRIQFSVPIAENATDTWRFAVVVGWGGGDCGRFRDGVGEFFGGGRPAESAEGNEADDVEPRFHDTIVPPGMSEEEVMNDYDHLTGRRVTLPMVSPRVD